MRRFQSQQRHCLCVRRQRRQDARHAARDRQRFDAGQEPAFRRQPPKKHHRGRVVLVPHSARLEQPDRANRPMVRSGAVLLQGRHRNHLYFPNRVQFWRRRRRHQL